MQYNWQLTTLTALKITPFILHVPDTLISFRLPEGRNWCLFSNFNLLHIDLLLAPTPTFLMVARFRCYSSMKIFFYAILSTLFKKMKVYPTVRFLPNVLCTSQFITKALLTKKKKLGYTVYRILFYTKTKDI